MSSVPPHRVDFGDSPADGPALAWFTCASGCTTCATSSPTTPLQSTARGTEPGTSLLRAFLASLLRPGLTIVGLVRTAVSLPQYLLPRRLPSPPLDRSRRSHQAPSVQARTPYARASAAAVCRHGRRRGRLDGDHPPRQWRGRPRLGFLSVRLGRPTLPARRCMCVVLLTERAPSIASAEAFVGPGMNLRIRPRGDPSSTD